MRFPVDVSDPTIILIFSLLMEFSALVHDRYSFFLCTTAFLSCGYLPYVARTRDKILHAVSLLVPTVLSDLKVIVGLGRPL